MQRMELLNLIAEEVGAETYLEIGVRFGACLSRVRVSHRVGVDPQPMLHQAEPEDRPGLEGVELHICTSDAFFGAPRPCFDLIFVDGMHRYEFAMRDLLNALNHVRPGGFVVMHDMCPANAVAASRIRRTTTWNGDVWKVSLDVHRHHPEIGFFVVNSDHGLGVFWKRDPSAVLPVGWRSEYERLGFGVFETAATDFQPRVEPRPEALRERIRAVRSDLHEAVLDGEA